MPRPLALFLLPLLLLAPTAARARPDARGITLEPLPAVVHAGQVVTLRWNSPAADIEELEVLLSVDGGRTFTLRVSPQLEPRERAWRWRVPDLPTPEARLVIRAGDGRDEADGEPTAAFRIAAPGGPYPARGGHRVRRTGLLHGDGAAHDPAPPARPVHEGAWWEHAGALDGPRDAGMSAASAPALGVAACAAPACALSAPATPPGRSAAAVPAFAAQACAPCSPAASRVLASRPLRVPLRN